MRVVTVFSQFLMRIPAASLCIVISLLASSATSLAWLNLRIASLLACSSRRLRSTLTFACIFTTNMHTCKYTYMEREK
jgi:hypothetical protein